MRHPIQALLCDLDGTLIDSIPLILKGYHHTRAHFGLEPLTDSGVREHLGMPLTAHLAEWFPDPKRAEAAVGVYREFVLAAHDLETKAFPGVALGLQSCLDAGVRLGVVTSKTKWVAQRGLEVTGLSPLFEFVVGAGDTERGKPSPEPILAALDTMGVEPGSAAYLGDTVMDTRASKAAGTHTLVAGWGLEPGEDLGAGPQTWVQEPEAILACLSGLNGGGTAGLGSEQAP